ncbi:MAG: patatin-like phospholipase family protein [Terriglobales bacterium]|jgi:NTE family protein
MKRTCPLQGTRGRSYFLFLRIALILSAVSLSPLSAIAQSLPPAPKRLTIGVALEGGGALGLAHIGVLRWFEQHHIPIDYLSGNSMGALVGGMYATGKSPDELEQLVKGMDWPLVIGGETPYADLSFRRKEDMRAIQNNLVVGLKHGVTLPSGLSSGHQIGLVIDHETLAYSSVKSFDDLPIPFRCVSTELISEKAHVFSTGPIGFAMRSSMSLPGIFAPIRDGDRVYVDGALVDNLPTDLVRDMGPDVVIAIHLQVAPATANEIQSLFSVLGQSITVGTANTELRGMEAADIVVKVELQKFTALEFKKAEEIIQKGTEAAEAKSKILQPYELDQAAWDEYVAKRDARKRAAAGIPQFVKVAGTNPDAEQKITKFLQPLVGKPIDTKALDTYLTRLTGIGRFESASYGLTQEDGRLGLLVTVREKNYAPPVLQPAFVVDGEQPDNVTFTAGGRLTFLDIAGYGSELRTDFSLGNTYGISTEFYKRFTQTTRWFFAPRVSANDTAQWIYSNGDPKADYRIGRLNAGLDFGYALSRFSEVRAGYEIGYLDARLKLGAQQFPSVKGQVEASRFRFLTDHRDDPVIPRQGYSGDLTFHWMDTSPGAPSAFPNLELRTEVFQTISKPSSIFLSAQGASTLGYDRTGIPQYYLGGTAGLFAYGPNEVRGDQYFLFRAGYLHRLLTLPPFLGDGLYAITFYEVGKMYNAPDVSKLPTDGAAGFIARTALGPMFIGGSVGDTGHATWFFALGRVF